MTVSTLPDSAFALGPDSVQVWHADLAAARSVVASQLALLDERERARAARLRLPEDQAHFVAAHALARMLIGRYACCPAEAVRFALAAKGKPSIVRMGTGPDLRFNASRTSGHTVFAFTLGREIGVDVEHIRPRPLLQDLFARTMTANELERMRTLATDEARQEAFFALWAQKEALMKAHGDGLGIAPALIDLSLTTDSVQLPGDPDRRWRVEALDVHASCAAAVAAESAGWAVESVRNCTDSLG